MSVNKKIIETEAQVIVEDAFNVVTYTGTGSSQSITGVGFKPDLCWIKQRNTTRGQNWYDSTRGVENVLFSNGTGAASQEPAGTTLGSFDTDGFTVGTGNGVNQSGGTYVAWCWRANEGTTSSDTNGNVTTTVQANQTSMFSIAKSATGRFHPSYSFGHGLGDTPELIIVKALDIASEWRIYSSHLNSWNGFLQLNSTAALVSAGISTTVNSTTISGNWVPDSATYDSSWLFYSFKSVEGYSSFGTYTGNGSTTGPTITTGFEPAYVMSKNVTGTESWYIWDNKRSTTNPRHHLLLADTNNAEFVNSTNYALDFLSNGFQLKNNVVSNASGQTYLYMAFAEAP